MGGGVSGLGGGRFEGERRHSVKPAPYCSAMWPLESIQRCFCKKQHLTLHITHSQRNPTTTLPQAIKTLCIIYGVICQHISIDYDLLLDLETFYFCRKGRGEEFVAPILLFTLKNTLRLPQKKNHIRPDSTFADTVNATPPEIWWEFLNTGPLMTKLKNLTSPLCKASTKDASRLWNESNLDGRAIPD